MRPSSQTVFTLLVTLFLLAGCAAPPEMVPPPQPTAVLNLFPQSLTETPFLPLATTPAWTATLEASATFTLPPTSTSTSTPEPTATQPPEITLLFTGVIVPARCVQASIDARGEAGYIFKEVKDIISSADLAVGTLNATLSDTPPHTGCIYTYVLVGDSRSATAMQDAGFDVMSVATNHIKNCGVGDCDQVFRDTLANLRNVGILPVGAGENHAEAMQPVIVEVKGVRFGIVSLGMVEPMVFADERTPGIAVLNEENLRKAIKTARKQADVVIAMPHWGPEDSPDPNSYELEYARVAVEAGADLVVGNHTHVVQAYQDIRGVPVFYGLGNFVFDQTWALDHQQGVILIVKFRGTKLTSYELIPTHVDGDGTVHIAGEEEAAQVLERLHQANEELP